MSSDRNSPWSKPIKPIKIRIDPKTGKINPSSNLDPKTEELARAWICTMLYTGPKKLEFFVMEGCKVMIYEKLEFEDLEELLEKMVDEGEIEELGKEEYQLSLKGKYRVRKHTVIPLLKLTENSEYARAFIEKNKENCDAIFIDELIRIRPESQREVKILEYAKNNYHKIATIIEIIAKGFAHAGGSSPTG